MNELGLRAHVQERFRNAGVEPDLIEIRSFPGETIVIVEVDSQVELALDIAAAIDDEIEDGFVTVRHVKKSKVPEARVEGVMDHRVPDLLELINARSRTSESQPSVRYVPDAAERINLAVSSRHHLIFGRRGVGKTALMLEARRLVEKTGASTLWVNLLSLRELSREKVFLHIAARLCDVIITAGAHHRQRSIFQSVLPTLRERIVAKQFQEAGSSEFAAQILPELQQAISHFCVAVGRQVFIFIDDVHYLPRGDVPYLLDMLHGITRDNPVWLKIAGIKHQTRWFQSQPPVGLQTGHDAELINLDITLEEPAKAREFLRRVLHGHIEEVGILPMSGLIAGGAVDRLVLASGGVPRDFLSLCSSAIQVARQRAHARLVGVQDVNIAAGLAAQTKLQELEEDAASDEGSAKVLIARLNFIRSFLLEERHTTFFRVDFRDKELHQDQYGSIQSLSDLRMLHIIHSSLSDAHKAGRRDEVYLLDLSQYSGSRLKQGLTVLDLESGHLVLKKTRQKMPPKRGTTARELLGLLRMGPQLNLPNLPRSG